MLKQLTLATTTTLALVATSSPVAAQTSNQTSTVGNDSSGNTIQQSNPQNNQVITFPNIYPLNPSIQNPVNTENDFGLNFGAALNTLDSRNVTLYVGFVYQPGRTNDHNMRMARMRSETQLIESQKAISQAQLDLLRKQIVEQELKLKKLQSNRY
jgi:hypothetical protein